MEFLCLIDNAVKEWESLGMLRKWEEIRKSGDPSLPQW